MQWWPAVAWAQKDQTGSIRPALTLKLQHTKISWSGSMANAKPTQIRLVTMKSRQTGPTETSPWQVCLGQVRQHLVWLLLVLKVSRPLCRLQGLLVGTTISTAKDLLWIQELPMTYLGYLSIPQAESLIRKIGIRSRITMQPISPSLMSSNTRMVIITTKNMPNATTR